MRSLKISRFDKYSNFILTERYEFMTELSTNVGGYFQNSQRSIAIVAGKNHLKF